MLLPADRGMSSVRPWAGKKGRQAQRRALNLRRRLATLAVLKQASGQVAFSKYISEEADGDGSWRGGNDVAVG
eukprot:7998371-Alexandrium_andersonii.AAC.1